MVLDLYSRKVVGWAIDRRCDADLVNAALTKAGLSRTTSPATVIHSDHGTSSRPGPSPRTSADWAIGSMGTVGDCYDNAPMESFWGTMQIELFNRQTLDAPIELSDRHRRLHRALLQPERRHSSLDYLTPNEFEDLHSTQPQATSP